MQPHHARWHTSLQAQFKHDLSLNQLQIASESPLNQPGIDQEAQIKPFIFLYQSALFRNQCAKLPSKTREALKMT